MYGIRFGGLFNGFFESWADHAKNHVRQKLVDNAPFNRRRHIRARPLRVLYSAPTNPVLITQDWFDTDIDDDETLIKQLQGGLRSIPLITPRTS